MPPDEATTFDDALRALDQRLRERAADTHNQPKTSQHVELEPNVTNGLSHQERLHNYETFVTSLETDLICPVCHGLFVAPHVSNPCGHVFCGPCAQKWIDLKKECPMCRVGLQLPQFIRISILDSILQQFIDTLSCVGGMDWRDGGSSLVEWNERLRKWRGQQAIRRPRTRLTALDSTSSDLDDEGSLYVPTDSEAGEA